MKLGILWGYMMNKTLSFRRVQAAHRAKVLRGEVKVKRITRTPVKGNVSSDIVKKTLNSDVEFV